MVAYMSSGSSGGGATATVIRPQVAKTVGTKDTATIIVGVIGAGGNTKLRHLPGLQAIEGVRVKTVCNRSLGSADAVARQFNIPHITDCWRDVVEDAEIDAVVIGTWPYMHATLSIAALNAGKHVLCEARMAMNAAEAHDMLAAARVRPELVAQIVPSPMTLAWDAAIQDIIRSGRLGTIHYITVKHMQPQFADPPGSPMSWRQNVQLSGQNVMTMGILYEALQRWVGDAKLVMAMAHTATPLRLDADTGALTAGQVPDHVDVNCKMACGAQAHMVFSSVTGAAKPPYMEFWLYGSEGTLHLDLDDGKLELARKSGGGEMKTVDVPHERRGFWRVEEEFINAIRGKEKVRLTDFAIATRYMEFTTAVARSAETGQAVALPLVD